MTLRKRVRDATGDSHGVLPDARSQRVTAQGNGCFADARQIQHVELTGVKDVVSPTG